MKKVLFFLMLTLYACSPERIEPEIPSIDDITCRILKVYKNGNLSKNHLYDSQNRISRLDYYNDDSLLSTYETFSYNNKNLVSIHNKFDSDNNKTEYTTYIYNENDLAQQTKEFNGQTNELLNTCEYLYDDCGLVEVTCTINRQEYEYPDIHCNNYILNSYTSDNNLEYNYNYIGDGKKPINATELIAFSNKEEGDNPIKISIKIPINKNKNEINYTYNYNEFNYPIEGTQQLLVVSENEEILFTQNNSYIYEYNCE